MLGFHVGEEHPQRFPYCGSGLHEQTPACQQTQPRPPPLQETPTPAQQDGAPLLHLQQGQVQELLHHVNTTEIMLEEKRTADGSVGVQGVQGKESNDASLSFAASPLKTPCQPLQNKVCSTLHILL